MQRLLVTGPATAGANRRRILVVGCCGSGKSTFARALGEATGLPVAHLDQHYWQPGWVASNEAAFREVLDELLDRPEWIIDGAYVTSLPRRLMRADAVVHLDLPRALCLARVLKRIVTTYGRTRADLAEGCPEQVDVSFLRWAWNWHRDQEPPMLRALEGAGESVRIWRLAARAEVADFLARANARGTVGGDRLGSS